MSETSRRFQDVLDLIRTLRGEGGCLWDRQQTIESLTPYVHQEFSELAEALHSAAAENVQEEMGDLLFLLLFVAEVARDRGDFSIDDVFEQVREKMIGRHPHIFGGVQVAEIQDIKDNWKKIKEEEKLRRAGSSLEEKMPRHLPALQQAMWVLRTLQPEAVNDPLSAAERLGETTDSLRSALEDDHAEDVRRCVGEVFMVLAGLSRALDSDPEELIRTEIRRLIR